MSFGVWFFFYISYIDLLIEYTEINYIGFWV